MSSLAISCGGRPHEQRSCSATAPLFVESVSPSDSHKPQGGGSIQPRASARGIAHTMQTAAEWRRKMRPLSGHRSIVFCRCSAAD